MTGSKRILIVSSNEDLIRHIRFNQYQDTFIIDLENDNQNQFISNLTELVCSFFSQI